MVLSACQSSPFSGNRAFNTYDVDRDNVISQKEAQASRQLAQNFRRIDTNNSGGIDPDEYAAASAHVATLDFARVDVNGDGVISRREAEAMPASLKDVFKIVDTDRDDNVSRAEYRAATVNLLSGVSFASLDRDGDQVIGKSEAKASPELEQAFNRVDSDGDGLISRKEFAAAQR